MVCDAILGIYATFEGSLYEILATSSEYSGSRFPRWAGLDSAIRRPKTQGLAVKGGRQHQFVHLGVVSEGCYL
jgi:hypothetical protein